MIKRYIEIRPLQREALFMEETDKIKIRPAKTKTSANEYVIYSDCDFKSTADQINNIVGRFNVRE